MKQLFLLIVIATFSVSGFYNNDAKKNKVEYAENERLCKIFTDKAKRYERNMRDDVLAKASLASYKHRAEMFCKQADEVKKSL